jgi:Legionella pneumophila major outer membrane protein precursor
MIKRRWAIWLVAISWACLTAVAGAQQYVTPGTQPVVTPGAQSLPYGGVPALRVAPDGAVHLDGPGAAYSQPTYAATVPQPVPVQSPATQGMGPFAKWLYNDPVPWQYNHRTGFFGDFLYVRPRNAEVSYALPIDGVVALGDEVPIGPVAVVDQQYEPAFRAGAIVRLTDGASIRGQYTFFRAENSDAVSVTAPDTLRSLVIHPNTANAASDILDASASQNIDFDLVDIDYRGLIVGCESCGEAKCAILLNGIVGGRYVNLDQDFNSSFEVAGTTTVDTSINFQGGGVRFGLEGEHHATATGFFVYGSGVTNLMVGTFEASYRQNSTNNGLEANTSWTAGRIVPSIDLELGVGWVGPRRRLKFSGGYLVSTWFNVVKTDDWIDAVQESDFNDISGTLTFDGLVARAMWEF